LLLLLLLLLLLSSEGTGSGSRADSGARWQGGEGWRLPLCACQLQPCPGSCRVLSSGRFTLCDFVGPSCATGPTLDWPCAGVVVC